MCIVVGRETKPNDKNIGNENASLRNNEKKATNPFTTCTYEKTFRKKLITITHSKMLS